MKILCTLPFAIKLGLLCIAVGIVIGLYLSERALAYPVLDTRDLSSLSTSATTLFSEAPEVLAERTTGRGRCPHRHGGWVGRLRNPDGPACADVAAFPGPP